MEPHNSPNEPVTAHLVAVPESAGSALYGMLDVLSAAGSIWQSLAREGDGRALFRVRIVAPDDRPFTCGNGVPVTPHHGVADAPPADIVIVPELWLGPDEPVTGRHRGVTDWIRAQYEAGAFVYSACSGSVLLAETGLLDGRGATSHWGYQDLFREHYPKIRFDPAPNLCFADRRGRIVTAGGTSSWHDLALHVIARHASPGEAMRIAKVYLMKWHDEGDLPFAKLVRALPHGDAAVRDCEAWLKSRFREDDLVQRVVARAGLPERTLKRRFKAATGVPLVTYVQNLRIEEAKHRLESEETAIEQIAVDVGYEDTSFFRRLFKRSTGLTPGAYRKLFQPLQARVRSAAAGAPAAKAAAVST
jgi:transcriptional regulator GlxA family with amidase domain